MRALSTFPILIAAGCLSEAAFMEKYEARRCEEFEKCVTSEQASCNELTTTTGGTSTCDFDKDAARECLRGTWTCDTQFEGYEFPIPPAACASVCGTAPGTVGTDPAI